MGEAVKSMVEGKGIGSHAQHKPTAVNLAQRELPFENGVRAGYDLLVVIPPHRCPPVVNEAGLVGETGWVPVAQGAARGPRPQRKPWRVA
jgi:NADPH-dependent 2,4-dienoyl-CoA reductase/sulfur reductase-like enzyme